MRSYDTSSCPNSRLFRMLQLFGPCCRTKKTWCHGLGIRSAGHWKTEWMAWNGFEGVLVEGLYGGDYVRGGMLHELTGVFEGGLAENCMGLIFLLKDDQIRGRS